LNLESLGQIGELVGGLGVVVSFVYLAIQLRQNSKMLKLGNLQQTLDASRQNFMASLEGRDVIGALVKSRSGEPLTDEESLIVQFWFNAQMRNFENAFLQHQGGALDDEVLVAIRAKTKVAIAGPQGRQKWKMIESQAVPSFGRWVSVILAEDEEVGADA
jgi:hypothetical protein